ncbi:hypothetical protein Lal_00042968 [Lupinus albus]|nr:hypothetical protein Lal_00042968 [Lupinus albus]
MASSKTKRPRTFKSKQGESSSKSNPLNLTRLLANDAKREVFEENFHGRAIFTPKYANDIYPELVRLFYCNMNFRKNLMTSHVNGKDIVLDNKTFNSICCDIPMTGDITGFGLQMWHVHGSQSPLSYDIFITKILEPFGVSLDGETKVALNLRQSKIDIEVFHKMGFVIDLVTRRTYKHRTDRQTAPTDQPEPTTPNQPEFQAPSSSSIVMPSNQMIMDELVSLRGYITTRMDAIDTQNQQIHYELHRLSSRLNSMDIDEDSSEPEY